MVPSVLRRAAPLTGLLAAVLLGCSSGGGSPHCDIASAAQGPGDASTYFPMDAGSTWLYSATTTRGGTQAAPAWLRVTTPAGPAFDGIPTATFTTSHLDDPSASDSHSTYSKEPGGVTGAGLPKPFDTTRYVMFPFPLEAGKVLQVVRCAGTDVGTDLDGDGRNDTADIEVVETVGGDEVVSTPVGNFTARRVETRITYTAHGTRGQSATGHSTEVDWLAPGVGIVRSVLDQDAGGVTEHADITVIGYDVAGRRAGVFDGATIATQVAPANSDTDMPGTLALAFDGARHLVAWHSPGASFGLDGVRARFVDATGVSEPFAVVDQVGYGQRPAAAYDGTNHLVVSNLCYDDCAGMVAQRVTPAGQRLDGPSGLSLVSTGNSVYAPAVAAGAGGWLVSWATYTEGIRAALVSSGGSYGAVFPIRNGNAPQTMGSPKVAFAGGVYLVAWIEGDAVLAARVGADGAVRDAQPVSVAAAPGAKELAAVASDGSQFLVVWSDVVSTVILPGLGDLHAVRVGPDGALLDGPATGPGILVTSAASTRDVTAGFAGSNFVVAWAIDGNAPPAGIYAARISPAGVLLGSAPLEVGHTRAYARRFLHPSVAPALDGETFVTWVRNTQAFGETKALEAAWIAW